MPPVEPIEGGMVGRGEGHSSTWRPTLLTPDVGSEVTGAPAIGPDATSPGVLMVGPFDAPGGIAAVVNRVASSRNLVSDWHVTRIGTTVYQDGGGLQKVGVLIKALAEVRALLQSDSGVRIVHAHVGGGVSLARKLPFVWMGRAAGRRVILHIHSGRAAALSVSPSALGRIVRRCLRACDTVVVLAERDRHLLSALAPGLPVRVIRNPAAPLSVDHCAKRVFASPRRLVFMGYLFREKGVYDLLEALAIVRRSQPGVTCTYYGKGPEMAGIRLRAGTLGLGEAVRLAGWVSGTQWDDAFASADILVLPSYSEGMPLVILEAMGHGVPTISSRVGAIPEVVQDGVNGLLVEPSNQDELAAAILRLCDDGLSAKVSAKALDSLAAHSVDVVSREWSLLYREVLERSERSQRSGDSEATP